MGISRLLLAVTALAAGACAHSSAVERAYDGSVVAGRFIEPQAYAAFLRGTIAEASGHIADAVDSYQEAAREDPAGAEAWARLGEARCARDPRDAAADVSFSRALRADADYAGTWSSEGECLLARGDVAAARVAARRAVVADAAADRANVLLLRTDTTSPATHLRDALLALTLTARDRLLAWRTLAEWTRAHDDVALWVVALEELAQLSPTGREDAAAGAEALHGTGELASARRVAAAVADAGERAFPAQHALAARLAVDEAIAREDVAAVHRRATQAGVSLEETAARSMLAGKRTLAREIAGEVARADPAALSARLTLAVAEGADVIGAASSMKSVEPASAAAFIMYALALEEATSSEEARVRLAGIPHGEIVVGDDVVVRPAVELAVRGVLPLEILPPDGLVELAVLRGEPVPQRALAAGAGSLDARHRALALALADPRAPQARDAASPLVGSDQRDPIAAAASALVRSANGGSASALSRHLLAQDASDAVLAAMALRLAQRAGDRELADRARNALGALHELAAVERP